LDWTIVRFLAPKDGPARGVVRQGFYGTDRLGFNVTRADIAAFSATVHLPNTSARDVGRCVTKRGEGWQPQH
jgi:hypothetical protein